MWSIHNNLRHLSEEFGFTTENILGEYTECLFADKLGLLLAKNNNQGYDAVAHAIIQS